MLLDERRISLENVVTTVSKSVDLQGADKECLVCLGHSIFYLPLFLLVGITLFSPLAKHDSPFYFTLAPSLQRLERQGEKAREREKRVQQKLMKNGADFMQKRERRKKESVRKMKRAKDREMRREERATNVLRAIKVAFF